MVGVVFPCTIPILMVTLVLLQIMTINSFISRYSCSFKDLSHMSRCIVKTPCPRLTFLYLPWLPSPTGLGNRAPVPLWCAVFVRGVGNVGSNVQNDVGGTVTWNASWLRAGMMSRILYKARSGGNWGFFSLDPAARRTVSRSCPAVHSPGIVPDFLTVYFVMRIGVSVVLLVH